MASDISYYEDDSDDEAPDLIEVSAQDNDNNNGEANNENPANQAQNDNSTDNNNTNGNAQNRDEEVAAAAQHACPVTILSGFLGSGKTTLIQYILKSPDHGKRIAVIENEFGEGLAIESLIARDGIDPGSGSLQDLIELPNGCVCCTVKDSLVETLEGLIARKSDLDYILIEASGMADPGPIASVFWLDEALESRLRLDGIVTLVDGRHIMGQLEATEEAARQIAYADRILLNKVDLLEDDGASVRGGGSSNSKRTTGSMPSIREVEAALRSIHPTAPILKTSFSKIPNLDWILDADCFGGFDHLEEVQTSLDAKEKADSLETETHDHHHHHEDDDDHHHHGHQHDENCSECCHGDDHHDHHDHHHDDRHSHSQEHDHSHGHEHQHEHKHKHTSSITTIGLEFPGSVDVRKLNAWLADILWPNQDETDTVLTAMLRQQEAEGTADTNAAVGNTTIRSDTANTAGSSGTSEPSTSGGHAPKQRTGHSQQQIFRIKGIVSILSCDDYEEEEEEEEAQSRDAAVQADADAEATPLLDRRRFIVQAVHDLWDIQPVTSKDLHWAKHEERTGKIVVIGKFLQYDQLREGFRACFV